MQNMANRRVVITSAIAVTFLLTIYNNRGLVEVFTNDIRRYTSLRKHVSTREYIHEDEKNSCLYKWAVDGLSLDVYEAEVDQTVYQPLLSNLFSNELPRPLNRNPKYILNPDKYLLPIMEGGPNNQIFCMRETIFMAIKLNRTVVIPRFYKHFTDTQADGFAFIYPGHRMNIESVCNLVSCISLNEFHRTCEGQIDAVMTFRTIIENEGIMAHSGMIMKPSAGEFGVKVIYHPFPGSRKNKVYSKEIRKTFHSEDRCLIYQRPLFNLLIESRNNIGKVSKKKALAAISEQGGNYKTTDVELMEDITRHTQASPYIAKLAAEFLQHLVGNRPIVTVHWRYNQGDYFRRCRFVLKKPESLPGMTKLCSKVMNYTPEDAVGTVLQKLSTDLHNSAGRRVKDLKSIRDVYIAAPPSEKLFVDKMAKILWKRKGWTVHTSEELEDYFTKVYDCDVTKKHLYDLISSLEMEICARGTVFFRSEVSTWSNNVRVSRLLCAREGTFPDMDSPIL